MIEPVTKTQVPSNLMDIRIARGLTQWDLRAVTGVSVATISAIEANGLYPTPNVRRKIASGLCIEEGDIWPLGDNLP